MHMRTRSAIAVAGLASLMLAACGSGDADNDNTPAAGGDTTTQAPATTEPSSTDPVGTTEPPAPTTEPSATASETSAPAPGAGTTITIWADDLRVAALRPQAEAFTNDTGIEVKLQVVANEKLRDQFKNSVAAGKGPDIVVGAHDWTGELAQGNTIAPIQMSDDLKAGFTPESIEATQFNGQVYGVPYAVESLALIRNTDLAPDAPATMEDLVTTGKKLVADKKAERVMLQEIGKEGNAYNIYPYLSAYEGGIFAKTAEGGFDGTKLILNDPNTIKGAEKLAWLGKEKALSANVDGSNAIPLFVDKKSAYLITGPWAIEQVTKAKINYAIDPIPDFADGGKTSPFLGVQVFFVNAKSKNLDVAQTFVQDFASMPEVQTALYKAGDRPPALIAAAEAVGAESEDIAAWSAAAEGGTPMPNIPQMGSVWGPLGKAGVDVMNGKAAKARMEQAQKEIQNALKG